MWAYGEFDDGDYDQHEASDRGTIYFALGAQFTVVVSTLAVAMTAIATSIL